LDKNFVLTYNIPMIKRDTPVQIHNFTNEVVPRVGECFMVPFILQHKKHFAPESFEVTPLDSNCDVILPYWCMAKHQLCNMWAERGNIAFTTPIYTEKYTKAQASIFSIKVEKRILHYPEALMIDHLSAITTVEELSDTLEQVPEKFRK
jgi:hypothetical protein